MREFFSGCVLASARELKLVGGDTAVTILENRVSQIDTEAEARIASSCGSFQLGSWIVINLETEFGTASSLCLINTDKVCPVVAFNVWIQASFECTEIGVRVSWKERSSNYTAVKLEAKIELLEDTGDLAD